METMQEISGGRGVLNPFGAEPVHVGLAVAQSLDAENSGDRLRNPCIKMSHATHWSRFRELRCLSPEFQIFKRQ
jgi:hypothetical protein